MPESKSDVPPPQEQPEQVIQEEKPTDDVTTAVKISDVCYN